MESFQLSKLSFCIYMLRGLKFGSFLNVFLSIKNKMRQLLWTKIKYPALITRGLKQKCNEIKAEFDLKYLTNPANYNEIQLNIKNRKGVGNIEQVHDLINQLNQLNDKSVRDNVQKQLEIALKAIPNQTHPNIVEYGAPMEIGSIGSKRNFNFKPKTFADLCKNLNVLRTNQLGNFTGSKSYYMMNDLVELVSSLIIKWERCETLNKCYAGTSTPTIYRK